MRFVVLLFFIVASSGFATSSKTKSRSFEAGRISIVLNRKQKKLEEPISEPYHVLLEIKCDRKKKRVIRRKISVCDTKLEGHIKNGKFHHRYYFWAAELSTTQGILICDYETPVIETIRLKKLCYK